MLSDDDVFYVGHFHAEDSILSQRRRELDGQDALMGHVAWFK